MRIDPKEFTLCANERREIRGSLKQSILQMKKKQLKADPKGDAWGDLDMSIAYKQDLFEKLK